jgi:DNA-binding SARP family transcriptional activator
MPFRIGLLGGFQTLSASGSTLEIPGRKVRALLAYLAVSPGPRERDSLVALLWGDRSDREARHSLRQALSSLRKAVPGVLTEGTVVALNTDAAEIDVAAFERLAQQEDVTALEEAARLYRGPFLAGFEGGGASFEEWRTIERERLGELALETLGRLLAEQMRRDALERAIQTALRLLAIDPLQEAVHRTLMRLFARQGRRAAALHQYQQCVGWMRHELGVEPEEETRELYRDLLRRPDTRGAFGLEHRSAGDGLEAPLGGGFMVGRGPEIESLRLALEQAQDSGARVVIVSGEAGIGKTRLIQEFTAEACRHGIRVLSAFCHESEQPLPFRPWIDALRSERSPFVADLADHLTPAARSLLGRLFPEVSLPGEPTITTTDEHGLLFEAMGEVIEALVCSKPLIIVLEDLHWADTMSTRLLGFLGRRLGALPILIVGSTRPEEAVELPVLDRALAELRAAGRLKDIAVDGLSRAESLALARTLYSKRNQDPGAIEAMADELWALSDGNPFVIVETVLALDSGIPVARAPLLAPSVRQAVAARLGRLGELARRAVAAAATIGRPFSFRVLQQAAGLDEVGTATAVEELVRRRVLDGVGEALDFCHARIRRVAYEEILPARRPTLHAAVTRALESLHADQLDDVADQLGHHCLRAGDTVKALMYLKRFAGIAARGYALDTALAALRQAAEVVDQLSAVDREWQRLDLLLRQSFVMSIQGRQGEILELLSSQAERVQRVGDRTLVSEYHFRLAITLFYLGEYEKSRVAAEHALREGEQIGDAECTGKAMYVLTLNSYGLGVPQSGIAHATRALALLDRPHSQYWLGLAYFGLALNSVVAGALDEASDAAERAHAIGAAIHDSRLMAGGGYVMAWVHALRGECDSAIDTARRAIDVSRDRIAAALASGSLGLAYLERGDAETAVPVLRQAVERLISIPLRQGIVRHLVYLSEAYLLVGDATQALEAAREASRSNQNDGNPFNLGLVERALGRIAHASHDLDQAQAHLASALARFGGCGASFEAGRTRVDLAELAAARGDRETAGEYLRLAVAAFERANAPKRATAARERQRWLSRSGSALVPGAPATATGAIAGD